VALVLFRRLQQELARYPRIVAPARLPRGRRELVEFDEREPGGDERRDDLAEPAAALLEITLAPAEGDRVDAVPEGMPVAEDQPPALAERSHDARGEDREVRCEGECAFPGVDDRETAPAKLERKLVDLRLEERCSRHLLPGDRKSLLRRVDP